MKVDREYRLSLVIPEVKDALNKCVTVGGWRDFVFRADLQLAILRRLGIDPSEAKRHQFIMTAIAQEIEEMYHQPLRYRRESDGSRVRGYIGIKLINQGE